MRIARTFVVIAAAGVLFFGGYEVGLSKAPKPQSAEADNAFGSQQQAQDAVHRWSIKAREPVEEVQQLWSPRSMFIPTRNQASGMTCIQLRLERGAVGGEPVYCYKDNTTELVAEYSDVE